MGVEVRKATTQDLPQLLEWVRGFHAHHQISEPAGGLERAVTALLDDAGLGVIWIISSKCAAPSVDYQPVGYLAVCYGYSIEFGGRDAFIDEFYLTPTARGQGTGRAALAMIIRETHAVGIRALHLEVAHENGSAAHLYERLGFVKREDYHLMTLLLSDER